MKPVTFPALACPLNRLPLVMRGKSLVCASGHCFDIDKRGAVNLLPVQFKSSRDPGDSETMVRARRDFLEAGYYDPIANKIVELVAGYVALRAPKECVILDAGCGEGYYTAHLAAALGALDMSSNFAVAGLDIARPAIAAAARRRSAVQWIVASNGHLPMADSSLDIILCLFGFPVWAEFARVLKPRGLVITCDPGPDHLIELRRVLYPDVAVKHDRDPLVSGWAVLQTEKLRFSFSLPAAQTDRLLIMTPHGYRAAADRRMMAVRDYDAMTADVLFRLHALERSS